MENQTIKRLVLKSLSLKNFKGIPDLTIQLDPKITNISGANGTGKTTIKDAARWVPFNKNSEDKSDFNIKTLDSSNKVILASKSSE